eukprot:scaffold3001_cov122-Cylindrotheca_fusiformis.AAC.4
MAFGMKKEDPVVEDGSAWIVDNSFAEFVTMHTSEIVSPDELRSRLQMAMIKYMCLVGYTFLHGCKVFKTYDPADSPSYKLVSLIFACTGGGILVPIFLNMNPVPLAMDSYPIAIALSYLVHTNFPVVRDVLQLSPIFKAAVVFLYEAFRAYVVNKFTIAAAGAIAPSEFDFALFGPIICGTISGCGGAFLPLNKGLNPIKKGGLAPPMFSALIGATFVHLFTNLATDVVDVKKKAHVILAAWFILYGFYSNGLMTMVPAIKVTETKKTQ